MNIKCTVLTKWYTHVIPVCRVKSCHSPDCSPIGMLNQFLSLSRQQYSEFFQHTLALPPPEPRVNEIMPRVLFKSLAFVLQPRICEVHPCSCVYQYFAPCDC